MSLTTSEMTPADFAACCGNNNGGDSGNNNDFYHDPNATYHVIAAKIGETYYAMNNRFDKSIPGTPIIVTDGKVKGEDVGEYAVIMTEVSGGYTISAREQYLALKNKTSTDTKRTKEPYTWILSQGTAGTYRLTASSDSTRSLIFRGGAENKFGCYKSSNLATSPGEYFDIEILEVVGPVPRPSDILKVAASVTATPPAGHVYKGTKVTLSAGTATVLYHMGDGNWTEYKDPFVINETLTIVVKSQQTGMEDPKETI